MTPSNRETAPKHAGIVQIALIALLYHILGRIGLSITIVQVTPVWPASGLALAAVLIFGTRIWPGIWIGALTANFWFAFNPTHPMTSILVGAGNATASTVGALIGGFLLIQYGRGVRCLQRANTAFLFVAIGAIFSTAVSATIGPTAMLLGGVIPSAAYASIWFTWWMGDVAGVLVVVPLILSFYTDRTPSFTWLQFGEAILLCLITVALCGLAFASPTPSQYHAEYMIIPCLVWAVFRFGLRGASLVTAFVSCIAILAAIESMGPFITGNRNVSLLALQTFMVVTAMTALILSAVLTERKERTAEMIQAIQEAQQAHIKQVREAEEKHRKQQQMDLLSRLVSGIAHEVRSPLFAISTAAQVLDKKAPDGKEYTSLILAQVERLKKLTVELLELSRPSTAWLISDHDLHDLIRTARVNVETSIPGAAAKLTIAENGRVPIRGTPEKLIQAFANVMENAVQHSPDGSRAVQVGIHSTVANILILITDSGPGVSTDIMPHIFEPFFTTRAGGVGLGLIIAKQIVEAHRGSIRVYNNDPGPGCTFEIALPRSEEEKLI